MFQHYNMTIEITIEPTKKVLTNRERLVGILKDRYLSKEARDEKKFRSMGMDLKVDLSEEEI